MSHFLIAVLAFILAMGLLVTFHEFGHFWVARKLGVKVLKFSIGFGRPLWRWQDRLQTEYVIAAWPLGGYVKMLDESEGPVPFAQQAFNRQSVYKRFAIVSAGPLFNFIFAILAYWLMFMIGVVGWVPRIGQVAPDSIAARAGLEAGQEIISVDHVKTPTWGHVTRKLVTHFNEEAVVLRVQKQDETHIRYLDLGQSQRSQDLLASIGISPYLPPILPQVFEVMKESTAGHARLCH